MDRFGSRFFHRVLSLASWSVSFSQSSLRGAGSSAPGEIDYRLARQHLISEYRKGRLAQHEVCDAHPELMRAAREVAKPTTEACPICDGGTLVLVSYVFGPRLPSHGRCVTSAKELKSFAKSKDEFACYVVEVCTSCRWNHLARTFLLNPANSA